MLVWWIVEVKVSAVVSAWVGVQVSQIMGQFCGSGMSWGHHASHCLPIVRRSPSDHDEVRRVGRRSRTWVWMETVKRWVSCVWCGCFIKSYMASSSSTIQHTVAHMHRSARSRARVHTLRLTGIRHVSTAPGGRRVAPHSLLAAQRRRRPPGTTSSRP